MVGIVVLGPPYWLVIVIGPPYWLVLIGRDVNVFIFQKNDRFVYENDDEKSKTKRYFLKTIVF